MKQLLNDIDDLLAHLEDFTHGVDGDSITKMRYRIIETLDKDVFSEIEKEIKSFIDAPDNQMLIKGLRESLLIVGRHKKSFN